MSISWARLMGASCARRWSTGASLTQNMRIIARTVLALPHTPLDGREIALLQSLSQLPDSSQVSFVPLNE
jgi:hypothetical protein